MKPLLDKQNEPSWPPMGKAMRNSFELVDLGPFLGNQNNVLGVNSLGQRAGVSFNEESARIEAFLELRGTRMHLGTLGGSFSIARGINNRGEIVGGSLIQGDDEFHGFVYRNGKLTNLNELIDPGSGWQVVQAVSISDQGEIIGVGSSDGSDRIVLLRPRT